MNRASRFSISYFWRGVLLAVTLSWSLVSVGVIYAGDEAQIGEPSSDGIGAGLTTLLADIQTVSESSAYAFELADGSAGGEDFESDPFESFNEKMFWFNREVLDRFILKPVATAWDFVLPDPVQRGIHNAFRSEERRVGKEWKWRG